MDAIDARLVEVLRAEARLPTAEIARRVGLSRTATLARIRRLEDIGVILGYRAEIAEVGTPTHDARVGIVLLTADVGAYVRRLGAFPELREAESVAGEYDLIVRFACDSAARLDEVLDRIGGWRDTGRTTTWLILRSHTHSA